MKKFVLLVAFVAMLLAGYALLGEAADIDGIYFFRRAPTSSGDTVLWATGGDTVLWTTGGDTMVWD